MTPQEELLDYRRTVGEMYAAVRDTAHTPQERASHFRMQRDDLFRTHPQSALTEEQKAAFSGLDYFPYDPVFRFIVPVDPDVEPTISEVDLPDEGLLKIKRVGRVHLQLSGQAVTLSLFWLLGYGGGMFLPFRDLTNSHETYGGGRYLLDTIKHADLGQQDGKLILDFNFAYNPSCAYHSRWTCPLAPAENRLPVAVAAGEKAFPHAL